MEQQKVNYTLCLTPTTAKQSNASDNQNDNWLENNDADLLSNVTDFSQKTNVQNLANQVSKEPLRIFDVSQIEIKSIAGGFALLTDNGEQLLQTGDRISAGKTQFEVTITKEEIVTTPATAQHESLPDLPELDDIWQTPTASNKLPSNNNLADPFASVLPGSKQPQQDDLHFLYKNTDNLSQPQGSLPPTHQARVDSYMPALNINTGSHYAPAPSAQTLSNTVERPQNRTSSTEGNVLHDLGINAETTSTTLTLSPETNSPNNYANQAPADRLDELLSDDDLDNSNYMQTNNVPMNNTTAPTTVSRYSSNTAQTNSINTMPSLREYVKHLKRKLIG